MPIAILDFGTNTFNLLIAEKKDKSFKILYNGKQGVKLGKGGINKGFISPDAMERGMSAIDLHMQTIKKFEVTEIHAYATSAMRNAENGMEFASNIKERFGFDTNIIGGEEEAALIYEGISESVDIGDKTIMILDIGGGSNEFIICNAKGILWKHSFELGMARIIDKFQISDPITKSEIQQIEAYYQTELKVLFEKVELYHPSELVGASGSFDTLAAMAAHRFGTSIDRKKSSLEIDIEQYREMHSLLLDSTAEERLAIPGMEPLRVEMIVPATIFINFVYQNSGMKVMRQSAYALKEGAMSRLVKN